MGATAEPAAYRSSPRETIVWRIQLHAPKKACSPAKERTTVKEIGHRGNGRNVRPAYGSKRASANWPRHEELLRFEFGARCGY